MTRDELFDAVWKGRIVSDWALSSRVRSARKAIGDSGKSQALIRTRRRHGFRFVGDVEVLRQPRAAALTLLDKPSIAVLPFENMSGDPEQEYFADGIAENITTALSRFHELIVIARNTSFTFKGKAVKVREIAQDLGVKYVLEGSVRRVENRVRVAAQLVDAAGDKQLWAELYDGELDDLFDLQDDITRRVAASLKPELERAEWQRLKSDRRTDINSWDLYLKGVWHLYKYTREDNHEALRYLRQAIEIDEEFGQACAVAANVLYHTVVDGYTDGPEETLREAFELAEQAVAIDDKDAYAHFVLGRVCVLKLEFEKAISELKAAIDLNPSLAEAHHGLGYALTAR